MYYHRGCTTIYRPLSYPFRSLPNCSLSISSSAMKNILKMKLTIYKKFSDLEHKYYPPHNPSGYSENAGSRARYHQTCRSPTCTPWLWRTGRALGSGLPGWGATSRSTSPRLGSTCLGCLARI